MTALAPLPEKPDGVTVAETIDRLRDAGVLGDCYADFGTVLELRDVETDFDRYESIGRFLAAAHDAARWWIAEWLLFGEGAFGDRYYQAAEATGLSPETLSDYRRVAEKVARSRRRPELHFGHHREVAKFNAPEEQDYWLQRAANRDLSVRELREEIRQSREDSGDVPGSVTEPHPVVELVRVDRALLAAIVAEASEADDPRYRLVPDELVVRLRAAIGEDET